MGGCHDDGDDVAHGDSKGQGYVLSAASSPRGRQREAKERKLEMESDEGALLRITSIQLGRLN